MNYKNKFIFLIILSFLVNSSVSALSFRVRAREHFDTVWVFFKDLDTTTAHSGIGPNLNFWLEEPYDYSIGLSYSHMFISDDANEKIPEFDEKMELIKWGLEYKTDLSKGTGGLFTRFGLSDNTLKTEGIYDSIKGYGTYFGLGWEIKFSQLGLAFEAAGRKIYLDEEIEITTYSPSIAVHFYGYI